MEGLIKKSNTNINRLAKEVGVDAQRLRYDIKNHVTAKSIVKAQKIADALSCTLEDIVKEYTDKIEVK